MARGIFTAAILAACLALPLRMQAAAPNFIVFFTEWSGALDESAMSVIKRAAAAAAKNPQVHLTVTGYADNKGTQPANQLLSDLRAQVVQDALRADGVPAPQISAGLSGPLPATGVIGRRVEITASAGK